MGLALIVRKIFSEAVSNVQSIHRSIHDLNVAVGLGLEVRFVEMMHPHESILSSRGVCSTLGVDGNAVQGSA